MFIQVIKFSTNLDEKNIVDIAHSRAEEFRALKGLIQKYYFKTGKEGEYGGLYIWQDKLSMEDYKTSDLAASIPAAYEIVSAPDIQILEALFPLRE